MHASVLAATTTEIVVVLIAVGIFALAWLVALFLAVVEAMPPGRKIGWFAALILLAPFSVPYFLVTRFLRFRRDAREGAAPESAVGT
jgi:hypothetical protein